MSRSCRSLLIAFIGWHYLLIRFKGISVPFWLRASGRTAGFSEHIKGWLILGAVLIGIVVVISILAPRDPGTAPQLISSSPLFGTDDDPGGLGFKPTYPISWTRGMNIIAANFGIDPDIWGAVIAMAVLLIALLIIPFVDRAEHEPEIDGRGVRPAEARVGVPGDGDLLARADRRRRPERDRRGWLTGTPASLGETPTP